MSDIRHDGYARSILSTCERLHMSRTGAGDTLSDRDRLACVEWLRFSLRNWTVSGSFTRDYDDAVRRLVRVTLSDEPEAP